MRIIDDYADVHPTADRDRIVRQAWEDADRLRDEVAAILKVFPLLESDSTLSFLPYSHVFERINGFFEGFASGASGWLSRGSDRLVDDLRECRPTIVLSVIRATALEADRATAGSSVAPLRERF